jgi:hypothetical protein
MDIFDISYFGFSIKFGDVSHFWLIWEKNNTSHEN